VGGKLDRQHGDSAVGEVNAGTAQPRLRVKRRTIGDVVGHVRDVHLQFEVAVGEAAGKDSVVEVAGGLAVNGHDRQVAEVAAAAQFRRGNHVLELFGFFQHLGREAVRQVILADDDLHVHAEVVFIAENFDHAAARVLGGAGPVG